MNSVQMSEGLKIFHVPLQKWYLKGGVKGFKVCKMINEYHFIKNKFGKDCDT